MPRVVCLGFSADPCALRGASSASFSSSSFFSDSSDDSCGGCRGQPYRAHFTGIKPQFWQVIGLILRFSFFVGWGGAVGSGIDDNRVGSGSGRGCDGAGVLVGLGVAWLGCRR